MKNNTMKLLLVVILLVPLLTIVVYATGGKMDSVAVNVVVDKKSGVITTTTSISEPATGEEINWQVISSGGTEGTSSNYILQGTTGQTAVGLGTSASYGLSHGFWQEFGGGTCCNHDGIRGDVDYNMGLNVADLTYLVDYLFKGGDPPPCDIEGDVDASGGINVADLTYMVDYLFKGGPPPEICP